MAADDKAARRLRWAADAARHAGPSQFDHWSKEGRGAFRNAVRDHPTCLDPDVAHRIVSGDIPGWQAKIFLAAASTRMARQAEDGRAINRKLATEERRKRLQKPAELFKRLRGRGSPPLAALRRPDGTIAVGLKEVEETHHAAWNEYYNREGNPDDIVDTFLQRYAGHLARAPPWIAPKITGADDLNAIHTWAPTAGGIDGTTPADMKHTSPEAAFWIAQHFRSIERNEGWPHDAVMGNTSRH